MKARHRVLALTLLVLTAAANAQGTAASATAQVEAATARWIDAFNRRDIDAIVALYAPDAVFFGTSSPVLRDKPALVREYFQGLTRLGADARNAVGEHRVQLLGNVALNSGYYTLTRQQDGKQTASPARFTFVYQRRGGQWLIVAHHSSALPRP
jgi:uncharacterized protein (TIGR02246 family)